MYTIEQLDNKMRTFEYTHRTVYENSIVYTKHLSSDINLKGYREYILYFDGGVTINDYDGIHVSAYNTKSYITQYEDIRKMTNKTFNRAVGLILAIWLFLSILSFTSYIHTSRVIETPETPFSQGLGHTDKLPKPETLKVEYIYKFFTVRLVNGYVVMVLVDDKKYTDIGCDAWEDTNDDGHNCMLVNPYDIDTFLQHEGIYADILMPNNKTT